MRNLNPKKIAELDAKAHDTVILISKDIERLLLVDNIINSYLDLIKSKEIKRFKLKPDYLNSETRIRIFFELLCFSSFCTSYLITKYLTTGNFFRKTVDENAVYYFYDRVCFYVNEMSYDKKFHEVYELDGTKLDSARHIIFGPTIPLDAMKRLDEYSQYATIEIEKVFFIFSKKLAKHLALENYPIIEPYTASFVRPLVELTENVVKDIFKN